MFQMTEERSFHKQIPSTKFVFHGKFLRTRSACSHNINMVWTESRHNSVESVLTCTVSLIGSFLFNNQNEIGHFNYDPLDQCSFSIIYDYHDNLRRPNSSLHAVGNGSNPVPAQRDRSRILKSCWEGRKPFLAAPI